MSGHSSAGGADAEQNPNGKNSAESAEAESSPQTIIHRFETRTVLGTDTEVDQASLSHDLKPGEALGKYEIRKKLGAGGMGAVYLAFDPMIEREVAVKVLSPEIAGQPQALDRFLTEARATGKLNHPHVVAIHDIGTQDDLSYIVMEMLRGGSVLEQIEARGRLPWQDACRIVADAAEGLAAAHAAGLIHRDIKPDNLMLTGEQNVKIVDFGLAKLLDTAGRSETAVTRVGQVMGTPQFMSPEQFSGAAVDRRSDIYSLGGTLFQMLTGSYPFGDAPTIVQLMYAHLEQPVPDPRAMVEDVPIGCGAVIARAMAKSVEERYQDASEMARDLRELIRNDPAAAESGSVRTSRSCRPLKSACVIEPSRMQAMVFSDALRKAGLASVDLHQNGQAVLDNSTPAADLVVTAMHLPDMSGLELIRQLSRDGRHDESMLVLNSNDVSVEQLVKTCGGASTIALMPKKAKPAELIRGIHACTFFSIPAQRVDNAIDPMSLRMLVLCEGNRIPEPMAELIREAGVLDVRVAPLTSLSSPSESPTEVELVLAFRTAGDASGDTSLYTGLLSQISDASSVDARIAAAVQIDGYRLTLRAATRGGFTSVTRCPLDAERFMRILQATS